jgi:hypothetical protein
MSDQTQKAIEKALRTGTEHIPASPTFDQVLERAHQRTARTWPRLFGLVAVALAAAAIFSLARSDDRTIFVSAPSSSAVLPPTTAAVPPPATAGAPSFATSSSTTDAAQNGPFTIVATRSGTDVTLMLSNHSQGEISYDIPLTISEDTANGWQQIGFIDSPKNGNYVSGSYDSPKTMVDLFLKSGESRSLMFSMQQAPLTRLRFEVRYVENGRSSIATALYV